MKTSNAYQNHNPLTPRVPQPASRRGNDAEMGVTDGFASLRRRLRDAGVEFFVVLFLFATASVNAQPSSANSISFQGALNGADLKPLANGNYNLTFKFYDVLMGGTALATSTVPNVTVTGGIASTSIPVDAARFNGQTRYFGIAINGASELTPRVLMTAVPYALSAQALGDHQVYVTSVGEFAVEQIRVAQLRAPLLELGNFQDAQPTELRIIGPNTPAGDNYRSEVNFHFLNAGSARIAAYRGGLRDTYLEFMTQRPDASGDEIRVTIDPYGRVGINTQSPQSDLDVRGTTRTQVLQITGGADLAEPFDVTSDNSGTAIIPGMVTVIDREHDGKLVPCTRAYDTAVAGVISGANGLSPGLVMKAEGQPHADGEQPLAMSGRVWCWVDASAAASGGPVKRGDRLTTSTTFGHAMKASDECKAPGAVIGKAMTELPDGKGLVLVLVNLQ